MNFRKSKKTCFGKERKAFRDESAFKYVEEKSYKIQYRVLASRYRGKTICPVCNGTRLRPEARYVKIAGKDITELAALPITNCLSFFSGFATRCTG